MSERCAQCRYWRQPHADDARAERCYEWRWWHRGGELSDVAMVGKLTTSKRRWRPPSGPSLKAPYPDLRGNCPACTDFEKGQDTPRAAAKGAR
jgi:hypothetical protein